MIAPKMVHCLVCFLCISFILPVQAKHKFKEEKEFYKQYACGHIDSRLKLKITPSEKGDPKYALVSKKKKENIWKDVEAVNKDGSINALIEIPAGCRDKWEYHDGQLLWDKKKGKVRFVKYLSYPGSYGTVPKTRAGDGDPIDVIVLGPTLERGSIIPIRLIGVIKMIDRGDEDHKLVAVPISLKDKAFDSKQIQDNGVMTIVSTFFANYKGPKGKKKMQVTGIGSALEAQQLFEKSIQ